MFDECLQPARREAVIVGLINVVRQLHGKTYFRVEHYLPLSVLDKVDQTTIKEELPKLHNNYYGASESEAEFEFLKVPETQI